MRLRDGDGKVQAKAVGLWTRATQPVVLGVETVDGEDLDAALVAAWRRALDQTPRERWPELALVERAHIAAMQSASTTNCRLASEPASGPHAAWPTIRARVASEHFDLGWYRRATPHRRAFVRAASDLFSAPDERRMGGALRVGKRWWAAGWADPRLLGARAFTLADLTLQDAWVVSFRGKAAPPFVQSKLPRWGWHHADAFPVLQRHRASDLNLPLTHDDFGHAALFCRAYAAALRDDFQRARYSVSEPGLGSAQLLPVLGPDRISPEYALDFARMMVERGESALRAVMLTRNCGVAVTDESILRAVLPEADRPRWRTWRARLARDGLVATAIRLDMRGAQAW